MKSYVVPVLVVFVMSVGSMHAMAQASVEITINNINSTKGEVRIGLFDEQNFLKEIVDGKIVKAVKGSITVVFDHVKPGAYAISILHDENGNGILDRTKLGIPKEGFAFGNNAIGKKGPPTFDKAKIEVTDKPVKQVVTMKYM